MCMYVCGGGVSVCVVCGVVWCGVVWLGVVWCGVVWCGVVWCCGLCVCQCAVCGVRVCVWVCSRVCACMWSCADRRHWTARSVCLIFNKTMKMSLSARHSYPSGMLMNLASVDCDNLMNFVWGGLQVHVARGVRECARACVRVCA